MNNASLANPFRVSFTFAGPGAPGRQPFTISRFDSAGVLVKVLETGYTVPIPEPTTAFLLLCGIGALSGLKSNRLRTGR